MYTKDRKMFHKNSYKKFYEKNMKGGSSKRKNIKEI